MSQRKKNKESVHERDNQNNSRRIKRVKCNENQRKIKFHRNREWLEMWEGCGKGK